MNIKDRLERLLRSSFIGFVLAVVVILIHPEVQNSIVLLFAFLTGKNVVDEVSQTKEKISAMKQKDQSPSKEDQDP